MKKSELIKLIKEEIEELQSTVMHQSRVASYYNAFINFLTDTIYSKLNDEEIQELNVKLKKWFNTNA